MCAMSNFVRTNGSPSPKSQFRSNLTCRLKTDSFAGTNLCQPGNIRRLKDAKLWIAADRRTIPHGHNGLTIAGHLDCANQDRFAEQFAGLRAQGAAAQSITGPIALRRDCPFLTKELLAFGGRKHIPLGSGPNAQPWG